MKILITGGGGFLGSRLARALQAREPKAAITLLDMAFPAGLERDFRCVKGDVPRARSSRACSATTPTACSISLRW